jgi:hypothetical protein
MDVPGVPAQVTVTPDAESTGVGVSGLYAPKANPGAWSEQVTATAEAAGSPSVQATACRAATLTA